MNDPPDVSLVFPVPDAQPQVSVAIPATVSDPDVGAGLMELEIDVTSPSGLPLRDKVRSFRR